MCQRVTQRAKVYHSVSKTFISIHYYAIRINMIQTKMIAIILLVAITAIGAIGIGIGTTAQSAHAFILNPCGLGPSTCQDNQDLSGQGGGNQNP